MAEPQDGTQSLAGGGAAEQPPEASGELMSEIAAAGSRTVKID